MDLVALTTIIPQQKAKESYQKWKNILKDEGIRIIIDNSYSSKLYNVVEENKEPLIYININTVEKAVSKKGIEILTKYFDTKQGAGLVDAEKFTTAKKSYSISDGVIITNHKIGYYPYFHEYDAWSLAALAIAHESEVQYDKLMLVTADYASRNIF